MKNLVTETALEAVEKAFKGVKLEHGNVRYPKMKFKGTMRPTVIRRHRITNKEEKKDKDKREPEYLVKFRHKVEDMNAVTTTAGTSRPTEIVVEVNLPEFESTKNVQLDVTESKLTLESEIHSLSIGFPYPVEEEKGQAKFDKSTRRLTVTAPVRPANEVKRLVSTDSGIEVDMGYLSTEDLPEKEEEDEPEKEIKAGGLEEDDEDEDLLLPTYQCKIYEDIMVFTLDVKKVDERSLEKFPIPGEPNGFRLRFTSIGGGLVPFRYGFSCALVVPPSPAALEADLELVEVEVWDNNVIVKFPLPADNDCDKYKVGLSADDMAVIDLPRLKSYRKRKEILLSVSFWVSALP